MIKVYMGLPSTGWTSSHQMHQLRKIEEKYKAEVELVWPTDLVQRFGHDYARNEIVEEFLKGDCDVLFFLDSDVAPSIDCLDLITKHWDRWEVSGCPYPVIMCQGKDPTPQVTFTVYRAGGTAYIPADIPTSGLDYVDAVGTGCMFIKRGVFLRVSKPYFNFEREQETQKVTRGEDLGFCMKLNELGMQFFIDYAMVCGHLKEVNLLDMNNYAVGYARKTLDTFQENLKQALQAEAASIAEAKKQARRNQIWTPS